MKLSRTAIKELTAAYRAVLKHALIASMGAVVVMPAIAEDTKTPFLATTDQELNGTYSDYSNTSGSRAGVATIDYKTGGVTVADNTVFENNTTSVSAGGAIKALNGITIGDSVAFNNNKAIDGGWGGGALYIKLAKKDMPAANDTVKIGKNSGFSGNSANLGGAIALEYANLEIADGAKFSNNKAGEDGGAIAIWQDAEHGNIHSSLILNNATFEKNEAQKGGAISNLDTGAIATINGGEFTGNTAKQFGGAIYNAGTMKVSGANFSGNRAETKGYGGAIFNGSGLLTLDGATFDGNFALWDGGAVSSTTSYISKSNWAKLSEEEYSIKNVRKYWNDKNGFDAANKMVITNSSFTGNKVADYSGGALGIYSDADITGSHFTGNNAGGHTPADNVDGGGAIYAGGWARINLKNSDFTENSSNYGGAIATTRAGKTDDVYMNISSSQFTGNTATVSGGAIANKFAKTTISDSEFTGNKATVSGGAIYNDKDAEIELSGTNTFTGNSAETGADIFNNGQLTIASGVTTIDGGIAGNGAMTIAEAATLNIGDATVEQKSIALDGNMIANLSDRGDKAIVTADEFTGNGKMSLIAKGEGEYKVFGGAAFAGEKEIDVNSVLYHLDWENDGTTVKLGMKSVQDIAGDNGLSAAASQTVMNIVSATSEKLNDFGLLVQEHLSNGDVAAVEKAHKVINPAEASAVQSVTSHIQGTVTKLAANRMSVPTITTGRSGGDVDLTAGGVWAQGLFNKSKKNGEFNGYTRGVAAGIDGTINRAFTIGAGYAFNHSDMDLDSRDTEIDSNTIFVYGQYKPSAWYANATLNYTMSDYEESGSALGVAVKSDYKINAFGGQVMTGYDFANGLTPEMGVRYLHVGGDTYTNSLGIKNKIDDADYLTAILGGKYATSFAINDELSVRPEVRLAAKYDMLSDEYDTAVAMPGINSYSVRGDRLNRFGGEAGLGVTMSYKDVDLSLTYDIEVRKDYTSQTGMVKARYNF